MCMNNLCIEAYSAHNYPSSYICKNVSFIGLST